MKINFILNMMGISGGVKDVFMFAQQLKHNGHEVNVVYPRLPLRISSKLLHPLKLARETAVGFLTPNYWKPLDWYSDINVMEVMTLNEVPDADISVATQWETAYYVHDYAKSKGEKFYLIQDHENWYANEKDVIKTYQMGLHNIVHSQWLKGIVEKYGKVEAAIPHAPDHKQFYPDWHEPRTDPIRVLMCYRQEKWKGLAMAVEAYNRIVTNNKRLIMFGLADCEFQVDEYYLNPKQDDLRRIYNSCDIFVFSSEREGWGVPPMEAMACGIPVVTTNVGGVPEYTIPGKTAIVVPPGDVDALSKGIEALVLNKQLRQEIAVGGYNFMKKYTWENSTKLLEALFEQYKN